jgi:hypothetical protein
MIYRFSEGDTVEKSDAQNRKSIDGENCRSKDW